MVPAAASEHLFPTTFQTLGYVTGGVPEQRREETSLLLRTVPLSYVVKQNLFRLVACVPKSTIAQILDKPTRGCLSERKSDYETKLPLEVGTYQLPMPPKSIGKDASTLRVLDTFTTFTKYEVHYVVHPHPSKRHGV